MTQESARVNESAALGVGIGVHEPARWRCSWQLEKRRGEWSGADIDAGRAPDPYETIEGEGNLLLYGGISNIWQSLIGNGGASSLQYFNNANAYIGVGDSTSSEAATQTDLQAATNKLRKAMDATYPVHADGTGSGAASIQFRSTFATGDANYAWQEWGVFNASSGGRMLNRKVESLGTKTSAASWTLTVTLSLS